MVDGINTAVLQGEIVWPEMKYVSTGKALYKAKLKIPSSDYRTSQESFTYVRIVGWEDFAEYLNSLAPQSRIRVSGRIQERSFENREGQKQTMTEVIVDGVELAETEKGENTFVLQGELVWPDFKHVGERQTPLLRAKVKVPYVKQDGTPGNSYVRITSWNEDAEGLASLGEGATVKVSGHIQDRTWTTPTGQKRVFTDAIVTNFTGV